MTELIAKEGYVYTNGELYSGAVYLSDLEDPADWTEIPLEEAEEKQREKMIEEGMEVGA